MSRASASFRQTDIERLIRAARKAGAVIDVDLRTMTARIVPIDPSKAELYLKTPRHTAVPDYDADIRL